MNITYKPFDQKTYNENDPIARKLATEILSKKGFTVIENPDKYARDLILVGTDRFIEVERSLTWTTPFWKYDFFNLLHRKFKNYKDGKCYCMTFNHDFTKFLMIMPDIMQQYANEELLVSNRGKVVKGEMVSKIPEKYLNIHNV